MPNTITTCTLQPQALHAGPPGARLLKAPVIRLGSQATQSDVQPGMKTIHGWQANLRALFQQVPGGWRGTTPEEGGS